MTERDRCERWFVRRGLPHLIDDYTATDDIFTRMAPFLAGVVFLEFFLAFGDRWTGWSQAIAFLGGIAALVGGVVLVNRIRGRRSLQLPDDIGVWELALYVLLPIVPTVIGSQGSAGENVVSVVAFNLVLLAVGYVVTSWALIPMMRWSFGQVRRQVTDVANLAMKSSHSNLIMTLTLLLSLFQVQLGEL